MLTLEAGYPEINLVGNGTSIADGDTTPSTTDDTDFGSHTAGGANLTRTFTIENTGTANLDLTGSPNVAISGSADFSISSQPLSDPVSASGSTTFDVQLDPTNTGTQTATISIANDDSDENPYTFDVSASISAANTAPTFTNGLNASLTVNEDAAATSINSQLAVDDSDSGQSLTWTVASGPSNGALAGFPATASSGGTGIQPSTMVTYQPNTDFSGSDSFQVQVSDGTDTDTITVNVTVDNLAPVFNSSNTASFAENGTGTALDVNADNGGAGANDSGVSYSITGGADGAVFSIDATTGELTFPSAPDFENPIDSDANNAYEVQVTADDGQASNNTLTQAITVTVTDVNEAPTITLNNTVTTLPDDTDTTNRVKVADIVIDDDALGSETISLAGADAGVFEVDGTELFLSAGTALDATTDSDLSVIVEVDDASVGSTPDDTAPLDITVTDATPPMVTITSSVSDPTNSDPFQVTITFTEPVSGFVVGDIDVTNGSASNLSTGDDTVFTADISAAADGTVTVDVPAGVTQDAGGNDNETAAPFTVAFDGTAPTLLSIVRQSPADENTNADTLTFRATFDTDVQNVDPADFTATGTTATLAVSTVTADSVLDLTVSGGDLADLDATVGIDLAAGQDIVDAAGNALSGSEPATDETYMVDNTVPSVTVDSLITTDATPPLTGTVDDNDATLELTVDSQTVTPTNNGDGTWTLADDTLSALADGTYDVAVTATDPAGNEDSDTTTDELTVTPDTDGDGIDDAIENAGPNGGDANNDGTPDADQSGVTSLPTATGRGYMTVSVSGACSQLQQVAAVDPGSLPDDPAGNPYPFGLVEFELPCETATVDVVYHGAVAGDFVTNTYRKYGPVTPGDTATADWYEFSEYATLNQTTWTLDLADNRLGDDTGDDGLIVDQGGPARGPAVPIPANQPWALWLLIAVSLLLAHRSLSRVGRKTF